MTHSQHERLNHDPRGTESIPNESAGAVPLTHRHVSTRELIHVGLQDLTSARTHLNELVSLGLTGISTSDMLSMLEHVCDPDLALSNLVRIVNASIRSVGPGTKIVHSEGACRRLLAVLGASQAMGMLMRSRPELVDALDVSYPCLHGLDGHARVECLMRAIGRTTADSDGRQQTCTQLATAVNAMRSAYRCQLAVIMADDTVASDPLEVQPEVSKQLSDLADAALNAALDIAKRHADPDDRCRFTVIAMGKLGARELNYVSDVDLIYVAEPSSANVGASAAMHAATNVATLMQRICQSTMTDVNEPPLWQIDGGLRPEGKDGPLVRRLESHRQYYEHWAQNWEFQALLKARPAAGDADLGERYQSMIDPFIWGASRRENFVIDCQQMRHRVENEIPAQLRDREMKLGRGGLRDVEFSVQMLQLVHGRTDHALRSRTTLRALAALSAGGYVSRRHAAILSRDYRFERVLEHRRQMWSLKRTHLFPDLGTGNMGGLEHPREIKQGQLDHNEELRRLARVFAVHPEELLRRYDATRREIRTLHLDIYYRPMLPISAQLDNDDVELSEHAARERFESIGFGDVDAAIRHVRALTAGVSRAARINRIILPAVLRWLGYGQDPDMGLLFWNRLEADFGEESEYLGFLRDSSTAAQRLCHILSNSRFLGEALNRSVVSVSWLGHDEDLQTPGRRIIDTQCHAIIDRHADSMAEVSAALRAMRRHEIERVGLAWMSHVIDLTECLRSMTQIYDAVIDAALQWAIRRRVVADGLPAQPAHLAVIAMGRYGGGEVNFSSDADAFVVYRAEEGTHDGQARIFAEHVVDDLLIILRGSLSVEPRLDLDLDLRPEGRNGPLVRSYSSCADYYAVWASTWEKQALLRARYAAGDRALAQDLMSNVIDPFRYPEQPLNGRQLGEIRTLKARMEAERLPRGVRRERHMKLGRGGLSDVEWTIQLMQLNHAHAHPELRGQGTLSTLHTLEKLGLMKTDDARTLQNAWQMCTAARNGSYLWSSRVARADVLPDDLFSLGGIAVYLGYGARQGQRFDNDIMSVLRRCREVVERLFYGGT